MRRICRIAAGLLAVGTTIGWSTTSNVGAQGPVAKCVADSFAVSVTDVATRNFGGGQSAAWVTATATFNCGHDVPPGTGSNCGTCEITTLSSPLMNTPFVIKTGAPVKGATYGCISNNNKDSFTARSLKLNTGQRYVFSFAFGGHLLQDGSCSDNSNGDYSTVCSTGVTCN